MSLSNSSLLFMYKVTILVQQACQAWGSYVADDTGHEYSATREATRLLLVCLNAEGSCSCKQPWPWFPVTYLKAVVTTDSGRLMAPPRTQGRDSLGITELM
ncbi:hypothetical protein J6590_062100 [Homalodisca vitripennis]|nr:hypothetical protein J6590_062100 [Homalodisca vitripennis]